MRTLLKWLNISTRRIRKLNATYQQPRNVCAHARSNLHNLEKGRATSSPFQILSVQNRGFSSPTEIQASQRASSTGQSDKYSEHTTLKESCSEPYRDTEPRHRTNRLSNSQTLRDEDHAMASGPVTSHPPKLNANLHDLLDVSDLAFTVFLSFGIRMLKNWILKRRM